MFNLSFNDSQRASIACKLCESQSIAYLHLQILEVA